MDPGPKVLVVEDDDLVREGVCAALRGQGYRIRAEADGRSLGAVLVDFEPDLALLDVTLPAGPDGFELARQIREVSQIPLVFITASDAIEDRLRGFDLGADDYVVKPFSMRELSARVRARLRHVAPPPAGAELRVGDLSVDTATRSVSRADQPVALTPTEFDILAALAATPGREWSKAELLHEVWGLTEHAPHLVEVQVSGLRKKLEAFGPRCVLTCRGGAYVLAG